MQRFERFVVGDDALASGAADNSMGMLRQLAVAEQLLRFSVDEAQAFDTGFEFDVPVLGHVKFVTALFFDLGVYLIVVGLVLDVLRSLGARIDVEMAETPVVVNARVS